MLGSILWFASVLFMIRVFQKLWNWALPLGWWTIQNYWLFAITCFIVTGILSYLLDD